ncbi:hypothetical protein [Amycolatopsis sp. SB7-3]|uniref:hypothetical protein n=1 Tax=Amycolatopsis sp. SB7-3 TaxID=3373438 RepID=UPI003744ABA7
MYTHVCQDGNNHQKWNNYAPGKFKNKASGLCLAAGTSSVFAGSCETNASDWRTSSTTKVLHQRVDRALPAQQWRSGGSRRSAGLPRGNRAVDRDEAAELIRGRGATNAWLADADPFFGKGSAREPGVDENRQMFGCR